MNLYDYQKAASRTSPHNTDFILFPPGSRHTLDLEHDLLPRGAWRLANAAIGISSEASELVSLLLAGSDDEQPMLDLIIKELGDVCWYAAEVANTLGILLEYKPHDKSSDLIVPAFLQVSKTAGAISETLKKFLFHGKILNPNFVSHQLSELLASVDALANKHNFTLETVLETNVEKLKKRYADGFSPAASELRIDLKQTIDT